MMDRKYVRNMPRMIQKMRYYHTMNVGKTQPGQFFAIRAVTKLFLVKQRMQNILVRLKWIPVQRKIEKRFS